MLIYQNVGYKQHDSRKTDKNQLTAIKKKKTYSINCKI